MSRGIERASVPSIGTRRGRRAPAWLVTAAIVVAAIVSLGVLVTPLRSEAPGDSGTLCSPEGGCLATAAGGASVATRGG
jgi:hypothetical protein